MADLNFAQGAEPVTVINETSGNQLVINTDGSLNALITVGGTVKTKQVTYNPPTVGDQATAVVAAVAGKKIRVYSIAVSLAVNSANIYLRDGAGGTQLSVLYLRTTGGSVPSFYYQEATFGTFLFETSVNTALVCNCSVATGPVSVQIVYTEA
jgi:hypothetical protein